MAAATRAMTLPHGVVADGRVERAATLRAPTGADEEWLLDGDDAGVAERVSRLLGRCVVSVGGRPGSEQLARELTCGDREALLLALWGAAFGDRLGCVVECSRCMEPMDVDLSVAEPRLETVFINLTGRELRE